MMNGTKIVHFTQNRINLEIFDKETQDFAMEAYITVNLNGFIYLLKLF